MRWSAVSDMDYDEACNPRKRPEPEPAPIVQSPSWWQAEYQRIAEATAALAVIRAEREGK